MSENNNSSNGHNWVATITGIGGFALAILAFLGIATWNDLLPANSSSRGNQAQSQTECANISNSFPQSLEQVREDFRLPDGETVFQMVYEKCGSIATGFIYQGNTEFALDVPNGGCIDSYHGAFFSEIPVDESSGGLRVYAGFVRTTGMTYRVWCEGQP